MAKQIVTWDSANTHSSTTLSNNNLGASTLSTTGGTRSTLGKSSGKWYLELSSTANGVFSLGIIDSTIDLKTSTTALTAKQQVKMYTPYAKLKHPEGTTYGTTPSAGDTYSILLDLDNNILEFYRNGSSVGVSHTNLSSLTKPVYILASNSQGYGGTNVVIANFGATAFKYPIPAGYNSYDTEYSNKFLISADRESELYGIEKKELKHETKMTSNTTPSPYSVTGSVWASGISYANYYFAFNGTIDETGLWSTTANIRTGWIQIDFGETRKINHLYLTAPQDGGVYAMASDFTVMGSSDGLNFVKICEVVGETWSGLQTKEFTLDEGDYRYLKIDVTKTYRIGDGSLTTGNLAIKEILYSYKYKPTLTTIQSDNEKSFIENGMEKNTVIDLFEEFQARKFLNKSSTALESGKVFKQIIDTSKIPIKKASIN